MLQVRLLGPIRALIDDREVSVDSARRRAILAALALRNGSTVTVDALCEALWGDELPSNARGNVQSHISRLRSSLGQDAVVRDHGGYRLVLGDPGTDVAEVERLAARAAALKADAPAEAARLLAQALDLWHGPALVEFADLPAFIADAARLDELRKTLIDDLHDAMLRVGDVEAALPRIQHAALAEPLRERAQLLLVRALHASGRSAEALRAAAAHRRRLVDETGISPSRALDELEKQILAGDDPAPEVTAVDAERRPSPRTTVLPRHGRFFGRGEERTMLRQAMEEARLVTVVGTGGVGKTRLVAEALATPDVGGRDVVVVELAATRPGEVAATVAAALGVRTDMGAPLDVLVEFLSVEQLLLVLDNCEHVAPDVHELVGRLLSEAPNVQVIATSRSRIGIASERVVPLGPLPLADADGSAVQLFADRARSAGAAFDDDSVGLTVVEHICRRLDGVPLAIELAARRAAVIGADVLLQRLDAALDVLEMPTFGADRRHATLRAVIEWSYRLLDEDTRRVLDALSVFERGFGADAAELIVADESRLPVATALARLVESSLVVFERAEGRPRHRLLEAVRSFAGERLVATGRERVIADAHARWIVDVMRAAADRAAGPDERSVFRAVVDEDANVRRAFAHALQQHDHDVIGSLATSIARLCIYRPIGEWLRWVRDAAGDANDPTIATRAAAARVAYLQGDLPAIEALARPLVEGGAEGAPLHIASHALGVGALYVGDHHEAERWWRISLDDPSAATDARLDALGGVALARCYAGDLVGAQRVVAEQRAIADAVGSDTYRSFADYVTGEVLLSDGRTSDAMETLRRAAALADACDAPFVHGLALTALASALVRHGRADVAASHLVTLLDHWWRAATWPQMWTTLRLCAEALTARDRVREAALILAAADCDDAAPLVRGADFDRIEALRDMHRSSLSGEELDEIAIRASATPRAQIVVFAKQRLRRA